MKWRHYIRIFPGCTEKSNKNGAPYANFNATATVDDGTCKRIRGCQDNSGNSINFDASAILSNTSECIPRVDGCTNASAFNYYPAANTDNSSCIARVYGCMHKEALNYNSFANTNTTCKLVSNVFFKASFMSSSSVILVGYYAVLPGYSLQRCAQFCNSLNISGPNSCPWFNYANGVNQSSSTCYAKVPNAAYSAASWSASSINTTVLNAYRFPKILIPTNSPTASPTTSPTASPTASPSTSPTTSPSASPTTLVPTHGPTSKTPTMSPTQAPTTPVRVITLSLPYGGGGGGGTEGGQWIDIGNHACSKTSMATVDGRPQLQAEFVSESCVKPTIELRLALYRGGTRRSLRSVADDVKDNKILAFVNATFDIATATFAANTFKFSSPQTIAYPPDVTHIPIKEYLGEDGAVWMVLLALLFFACTLFVCYKHYRAFQQMNELEQRAEWKAREARNTASSGRGDAAEMDPLTSNPTAILSREEKVRRAKEIMDRARAAVGPAHPQREEEWEEPQQQEEWEEPGEEASLTLSPGPRTFSTRPASNVPRDATSPRSGGATTPRGAPPGGGSKYSLKPRAMSVRAFSPARGAPGGGSKHRPAASVRTLSPARGAPGGGSRYSLKPVAKSISNLSGSKPRGA